MSDSLQHHGRQHVRLPCPSPSPRVCSNSRPLSQWYHPTISFSVVPFSSSSFIMIHLAGWASQVELVVKKMPASAGDIRDTGSISGWGRSPKGRHGNSLQYSCLEESCGQRSLEGYSPWGLPGVLGFFFNQVWNLSQVVQPSWASASQSIGLHDH